MFPTSWQRCVKPTMTHNIHTKWPQSQWAVSLPETSVKQASRAGLFFTFPPSASIIGCKFHPFSQPEWRRLVNLSVTSGIISPCVSLVYIWIKPSYRRTTENVTPSNTRLHLRTSARIPINAKSAKTKHLCLFMDRSISIKRMSRKSDCSTCIRNKHPSEH